MRRIVLALILLLVGSVSASAQEQQILQNVLINKVFTLGAAVPLTMEGTTNNAFEFRWYVDPTADIVWQGPNADGASGEQLQTAGSSGVLTWASAGSTRDKKLMAGLMAPTDALQAVLSAPVHRFHYKPGMGTQDSVTEYVGIVADEAPWAMHFNGTILNPVNTVGYAFASIQALQAEIDALKAQIAARRPHRTWRTLWLVKE